MVPIFDQTVQRSTSTSGRWCNDSVRSSHELCIVIIIVINNNKNAFNRDPGKKILIPHLITGGGPRTFNISRAPPDYEFHPPVASS